MQQDLRTKKQGVELFYTNPMIRKITRIEEKSADCATYSSIGNKCAFFMAMVIVGVLLLIGLQMINPSTIVMEDGSAVTISTAALLATIPFGLFFIIMPFIAMLIKKTIPVTGTLYCMSVGYCISLMAQLFAEYRDAISLALIITIAIVAVMAQVYSRGWIKVDDKFRSIMKILFFTSIASGLLMLVAYFIPQLRGIVMFVAENPVLSLAGSVVYVVIASLFLLVDFDAIQNAVEGKMPRKYEWIAAFGLAFSVIWLFLKVLDLILKMTGKDSSDK
ncbi:MAG: Bax inhibitor-1/YccA family protein [Clostridia bacterium]|nr:Bax inhibitor-1/YccA family protein [Clostridia bacterium]